MSGSSIIHIMSYSNWIDISVHGKPFNQINHFALFVVMLLTILNSINVYAPEEICFFILPTFVVSIVIIGLNLQFDSFESAKT